MTRDQIWWERTMAYLRGDISLDEYSEFLDDFHNRPRRYQA